MILFSAWGYFFQISQQLCHKNNLKKKLRRKEQDCFFYYYFYFTHCLRKTELQAKDQKVTILGNLQWLITALKY